MATAVNPLWVDGRSSAANVQVCGWGPRHFRITARLVDCGARSGLHHHCLELRFHAREQQRGKVFAARVNAVTGGIKDAEDYRTALLFDSPQVFFICGGGI